MKAILSDVVGRRVLQGQALSIATEEGNAAAQMVGLSAFDGRAIHSTAITVGKNFLDSPLGEF